MADISILNGYNIKDKEARESINNINNDITGINNDITGINNDITGINNDITGINNDITGINENLGLLNSLFIEDTTYTGCFYRMVGAEKEWINPPMIFSTEYRLAEKFNGKPVYTKAFNLGDLPAASSVKSPGSIPDMVMLISAEGSAFDTTLNETKVFPLVGSGGAVRAEIFVSSSKSVTCYSYKDNTSMNNGIIIVKYTKS